MDKNEIGLNAGKFGSCLTIIPGGATILEEEFRAERQGTGSCIGVACS